MENATSYDNALNLLSTSPILADVYYTLGGTFLIDHEELQELQELDL